MKEEFERDIRREEDLPYSRIGGINIAKIGILTEAIYVFNAILTKITIQFFIDLERTIFNFICITKTPRTVK